jgi:uncharacterized OB-fold protein
MVMSYLPDVLTELPKPEEEAAFWDNCARRRLAFQCCGDCGKAVHPPLPACPACQSLNKAWVDAPDEARVFSFTWAHVAADPSVSPRLPYNIALIEFPALPGIRLVSNVVNCQPGELSIGDAVCLTWDPTADNRAVPRFKK